MCGFIVQLVEHRTGIAEVTGSNPVEALIFSGFLHSSLSYTGYMDLISEEVIFNVILPWRVKRFGDFNITTQ